MNEFKVITIEDVLCFTPKDVQKILNCSKSQVYEIFHRVDFPSFKIGERNLVVKRIDFYNWQEEKKEKFKKHKL
nr:helix-turn-helix domain-containing protein [uncultured Cellulosilyticum sp.]